MKRLFAVALLAVVCAAGCRKSEPFMFIQITDPQIGFLDDSTLVKSVSDYAETIAGINQLKPDFVVFTGDLTNAFSRKEQMAVLDSLTATISEDIKLYYVPGNHDYRAEWPGSREFYESHFGGTRFSFMHKGSLFIGFDSNIVMEGQKEQEEEQFGWICSQIETYGKKADHIILFQHCPVVSKSVDEAEGYFNFPAPYRQKYLDMFERYGVDAVFSGHRHFFSNMQYKGTELVVCPACGRSLGKDSEGNPNFRGMNVVRVSREGIDWKCTTVPDAR